MSRCKVLITDYAWDSIQREEQILAEIAAEVIVAPKGDENTLVDLARDCDAIMTNWARTTGKVIEASPKLKIVARYGVGIDNIDVATATRLGVVVTNVPDYCVDEVSEHAFTLLLAVGRRIMLLDRDIRRGGWNLNLVKPVHRIRGSTLGVVGFGRIGRMTAEKGRAFGMNLIAYDPILSAAAIRERGAEPVDFAELLRRADYISLHAPLTPETHHLFDTRAFRQMKPNAVIVNTARGALIDTEALAQALREHWIGGAGIDVLPNEPPEKGNPLIGLDRIVMTSHEAFYSEESLVELQTRTAQEVVRVLRGERPLNLANPEVATHARANLA
jgi:D-3-phosphoglycerate dehydrogenase